MNETRSVTTVRLSKEPYHRKLKDSAALNGRTVKAQLEHILRVYFANEDMLERWDRTSERSE